MMPFALRRAVSSTAVLFSSLLAYSSVACAAGSSMRWEQPLQQVLQSVEGPVAKIVAVIRIINLRKALRST